MNMCMWLFDIYKINYYTPGIYAEGYIVFAFMFVRWYVRSFVTFGHICRVYHKGFG